jgi:ribA/ribD-fused uncharacterized protein
LYFYQKYDPFYEFMNFYPHPITVDGVQYPTSEHYFQAAKFTHTAPEVARRIQRAPSPRDAFEMARQHSAHIRPDWEVVKEDCMRRALRAKFTDPRLATMLVGTAGVGTGDAVLVERSPVDAYWGDGGDGS